MTIHAKQPGKLSVVNKTVKVHLGNSPENHRKYHCSYSDMLEWRLCVKSDWLSVVKSCCLCLLLAWIGWLHWSNHQLSVDVLELKNAFSFESRIGEYPLEKESSFLQVENMQQPDFISNDLGVKVSIYISLWFFLLSTMGSCLLIFFLYSNWNNRSRGRLQTLYVQVKKISCWSLWGSFYQKKTNARKEDSGLYCPK